MKTSFEVRTSHTIPVLLAHHELGPVDVTVLVLVIVLQNLINNPNNFIQIPFLVLVLIFALFVMMMVVI